MPNRNFSLSGNVKKKAKIASIAIRQIETKEPRPVRRFAVRPTLNP